VLVANTKRTHEAVIPASLIHEGARAVWTGEVARQTERRCDLPIRWTRWLLRRVATAEARPGNCRWCFDRVGALTESWWARRSSRPIRDELKTGRHREASGVAASIHGARIRRRKHASVLVRFRRQRNTTIAIAR
jgi:hypothetical protein